MVAVTELVDRLNMIKLLDAAIGPIKARDRGHSGMGGCWWGWRPRNWLGRTSLLGWTAIDNVFRDAKHGPRCGISSGYPQVNTAWMWGALLAVSIAG